MSNYIRYNSPEWKRMSQCLVKIGIYGTQRCRKDEGAYVAYYCSPEPAISKLRPSGVWRAGRTSAKADEAVALLQEKHPEYDWRRSEESIIQGVLR